MLMLGAPLRSRVPADRTPRLDSGVVGMKTFTSGASFSFPARAMPAHGKTPRINPLTRIFDHHDLSVGLRLAQKDV